MDLSATRARRDPKLRFRGTLMLTQCLIDGVQLNQTIAKSAIETLARVDTEEIFHEPIVRLMQSEHRHITRATVWKALIEATDGWSALGKAWLAVGFTEKGWRLDTSPESNQLHILGTLLQSDNNQERSVGLLSVSWFASRYFQAGTNLSDFETFFSSAVPSLEASIQASTIWESLFSLRALAWLAELGFAGEVGAETVAKIAHYWINSDIEDIGYCSGKALEFLPVLDRKLVSLPASDTLRVELLQKTIGANPRPGAIVAYYCGSLWSDNEIVDIALESIPEKGAYRCTLESLFTALGEAGQRGLISLTQL